MAEDMAALYNARKERVINAVELKPTDRVPWYSTVDNWALSYYGTTLGKAKTDMDLQYQVYSKVFRDFRYDAAFMTSVTMPMGFIDALGGGIYKTDMETTQIATGESELMDASEYDAFLADPMGFIKNTLIPRKVPLLAQGSVEERFGVLANAFGVLMKWVGDLGQNNAKLNSEVGLFTPSAVVPFMAADIILDFIRDFKGTLTDVRRCPEKLAEAVWAVYENINVPATFARLPQAQPDQFITLFLHMPPFMRPKDFEKIYWPSFKAYIEKFAALGHKFLILFEKNWEPLYDYLQELPPGHILGFFEEDDLRKTKAALGKVMCVAGGIKNVDLYLKTPAQCVDIAKRMIDELAPGGGFVFATDQVMTSKTDANPECLKAVADYIVDHTYY